MKNLRESENYTPILGTSLTPLDTSEWVPSSAMLHDFNPVTLQLLKNIEEGCSNQEDEETLDANIDDRTVKQQWQSMFSYNGLMNNNDREW